MVQWWGHEGWQTYTERLDFLWNLMLDMGIAVSETMKQWDIINQMHSFKITIANFELLEQPQTESVRKMIFHSMEFQMSNSKCAAVFYQLLATHRWSQIEIPRRFCVIWWEIFISISDHLTMASCCRQHFHFYSNNLLCAFTFSLRQHLSRFLQS